MVKVQEKLKETVDINGSLYTDTLTLTKLSNLLHGDSTQDDNDQNGQRSDDHIDTTMAVDAMETMVATTDALETTTNTSVAASTTTTPTKQSASANLRGENKIPVRKTPRQRKLELKQKMIKSIRPSTAKERPQPRFFCKF